MKPTNIFHFVLGAIGAATISINSVSAQTTVPITGGNFNATVTSGVTTFNSGTALTSLGTITFSSVTGGTTTAPSGVVVGNPTILSNGISSGSIGSPSQTFTNAPLNLTGTISSVANPSVNILNVGAVVNSGNIVLPNSLVSSLSTTPLPITSGSSVPITGGSLSVTTTNFGTRLNSGGIILTSFGPISILSATIVNFTSQNGAVTRNGSPVSAPTRPDIVGDRFSADGTFSGALLGNTLTNLPYAITGNVSSVAFTPPVGVPTSSLVTFTLSGGSASLPTSLVSSLSGNGTGGAVIGFLRGRAFTLTASDNQLISNIFGLQPPSDIGQYFVPPSGIAVSRVHPDLFAK